MSLSEEAPRNYVDIYFDLIEEADDGSGRLRHKLPPQTMALLRILCRFELGKTPNGADPSPKQPTLTERLKEVGDRVSYYRKQLEPGNRQRWTLNELSLFEFFLAEAEQQLVKLASRQRWFDVPRGHSRKSSTIDVEALKQANDLVEVAKGSGLPLRKRGRQHWCLCPFHSEKTASFAIDREKQVFFCHGCGEGGDVITFVMKIQGVAFVEACKKLGAN